jgi:HAD superfamily hydrolase (TIGR01459 family)
LNDPIPWHPGIGPLVENYDGLILDLWGVIHDGVRPYPGAAATLDRLLAAGKRCVMLSNAPRRSAAVAETMRAMGFRDEHCRSILCSGEAAWLELKERRDPWYAGAGKRLYHIGPERDAGLFAGLDAERVKRLEDADLLVNTGPWRDDERVEDYEDVLAAGAAAGLGMVCANPDLEVIRGGKRIICAGALALRYEALGGRVRWLGKPHPPIYMRSFEMLGVADRRRVLAIGDSLRTDIAGAAAVGVDAVLVLGGLHAAEVGVEAGRPPDPGRLVGVCAAAGQRPVAAVPGFVW